MFIISDQKILSSFCFVQFKCITDAVCSVSDNGDILPNRSEDINADYLKRGKEKEGTYNGKKCAKVQF